MIAVADGVERRNGAGAAAETVRREDQVVGGTAAGRKQLPKPAELLWWKEMGTLINAVGAAVALEALAPK